MRKIILCLSIGFLTIVSYGQQNNNTRSTKTAVNTEVLSLDSSSIENQFEYIVKKSGNYQEYEVVKKTWLAKLRKNVIDSLTLTEKHLETAKSTITNQEKEIALLKGSSSKLQQELQNVSLDKDSISFFGIATSKASYKSIMWGIIGVLSLLLFIFIYKFKNSNSITKEAKNSLQDLEEEFEEHRRRALEREQIVRRQLQDEINKQKAVK